MRILTLTGFLKSELVKRSGCGSPSVHKIKKELSVNPGIKPYFMLYTALTLTEDKAEFFFRKDIDLKQEYIKTFKGLNIEKSLSFGLLPKEYCDIYKSFVRKKDRSSETEKKKRLLERIKMIQREKNITNYNIYSALGLNMGNTNDFLSNGNLNKISIKNAEKILNYVKNK